MPPRQGHKKSREGCKICKQRHLKCDETRPHCLRCTQSARQCEYGLVIPQPIRSRMSSEASPGNTHRNSQISMDDHSPTPYHTPTTEASPASSESINVLHLELLYNYEHETSKTVTRNAEYLEVFRRTIISHSFKCDFLLSALLGCSAQHLSTQNPLKAKYYRNAATELQSNALLEFQPVSVDSVTQDNVLDVLLFQHLTALHVFSDCFALNVATEGFEAFLERLIRCIHLLRGINSIIQPWWNDLCQTEIGAIMQSSHIHVQETDHTSSGECAALQVLISEADLSVHSIEVCEKVLARLQAAFDSENGLGDASIGSTNMLFTWLVETPNEYIALLEQRRPEALIILAYYALLLHRRRHSWAVGAAGQQLVSAIRDYLGSSWESWLEWPLQHVISV